MGVCLSVASIKNLDNPILLGKLYGYVPYDYVRTSWNMIYFYIDQFAAEIDDPEYAYECFSNREHIVTIVPSEKFHRFIAVYAAERNAWDSPYSKDKINLNASPLHEIITSNSDIRLEWA
jgi:hypothetical protein